MIPDSVETWLAARRGWRRAGLCLAAGAALALGHAPVDFPWIWIVVFPLVLVLLARSRDQRQAGWGAWFLGVGYFALSLSWIVEPFLVDIARHGWMAPFALILLAGGLALFWAGAGYLAYRMLPGRAGFAAGFVCFLVLAEFLRARLMTGFPWAHPAYVWTDTAFAQLAAFVGPHGLALLVLLPLAALAMRHRFAALLGFVALCLLFVLGSQRGYEIAKGDPNAPVLRIVQPNAAQHLKWRPDMAQVFYERLLALTGAPAERAPDLVIWPESAVPFLLGERPELQADIMLAAPPGARVVLGIRRKDASGGWFNSLAVLGTGGEILAAYDKHHLVPFGEYMPLLSLAEALGLGDLASGLVGSFEAGPGPSVIAVPGLPAFRPLICYEVIFPHEIGTGTRPDLLLQVTNDAWFGTVSGPYQHLAQARMRAIEQGLPLVRAANTGISAVIDSRGRVLSELPLGVDGFLDASLPQPQRSTVYASRGDTVFLFVLALAVLLTFGLSRRAG